MSMWIELGVAVISGGAATQVLTAVFNRRVNRKVEQKTDNEAAQAIAVAAVTLVAPLEERLSRLEQQHTLALTYIRSLWSWIDLHLPGRTPPAPPDQLRL
ncbi:minor tail protein [Mycobacterium phage Paphu]|nr:minor tail protein [Mycobacterium phage Paphu]